MIVFIQGLIFTSIFQIFFTPYIRSIMKTTKIQKTKVLPLRWIGNFCGEYAGNHLVKAIDLDEELDSNLGFRYKYHAKMWVILNKPYERWGTYYLVDLDK